MTTKPKICCIKGCTPIEFPWDYYDDSFDAQIEYRSELKKILEWTIKEGFTFFISDGMKGTDMDFAESVLDYRQIYPNIKLEIVTPVPKSLSDLSDEEKTRYNEILRKADKITTLSSGCSIFAQHKRNRYMTEKSELFISVWHGKCKGTTYKALRYAETHNTEVEIIFLPFLTREYKKFAAKMESLPEAFWREL